MRLASGSLIKILSCNDSTVRKIYKHISLKFQAYFCFMVLVKFKFACLQMQSWRGDYEREKAKVWNSLTLSHLEMIE